NQHVCQISWSSAIGWAFYDATAVTGSPLAATGSALSAYVDSAGGHHWVFFGSNQHLYQLYWNSTSGWSYTDGTATGGGSPAAAGSALSTYLDSTGQQRWVYLCSNQHVCVVNWSSTAGWTFYDATAAIAGSPLAAAGSALSAYVDSNSVHHWVFQSSNQHFNQLRWDSTNGWVYQDVTAIAAAPSAAAGSALSTY